MKSNKSKTPQRIAVFIGLKLLEVLAVVFIPYWIGKITLPILPNDFWCGEWTTCLNWIEAGTIPIWYAWLTGIGTLIMFVFALAVILLVWILLYEILIKKWIQYNWQKAGKIVGVKQ